MPVKSIHHVGAGLRLAVPGMEGWLRVDGAVDPATGRGRVSVAWVRPGWGASGGNLEGWTVKPAP
jgi:hypothetical protein